MGPASNIVTIIQNHKTSKIFGPRILENLDANSFVSFYQDYGNDYSCY